jgi:hypothetical protein
VGVLGEPERERQVRRQRDDPAEPFGMAERGVERDGASLREPREDDAVGRDPALLLRLDERRSRLTMSYHARIG